MDCRGGKSTRSFWDGAVDLCGAAAQLDARQPDVRSVTRLCPLRRPPRALRRAPSPRGVHSGPFGRRAPAWLAAK